MWELAEKLRSRGFEAALISQVLDDLQQKDLLSERRFTEMIVHYRSERGQGPVKIRAELRNKGIEDVLIEAFLDPNDRQWRQRAVAVKNKRFGPASPQDYQEKARQMKFLNYRGFTAEQIRSALGDADDD